MISSAPPSNASLLGSHRVMRTETGTKKLHPFCESKSRKKRLLQSHVGDPQGLQNKVYQAVPSERRHLHHDALDTDFTTAPGSHIASTILVVLMGCGVAAATVRVKCDDVLSVPASTSGVAIGLANHSSFSRGSVATTIYVTILQHDVESRLGQNLGAATCKKLDFRSQIVRTLKFFKSTDPFGFLKGVLLTRLHHSPSSGRCTSEPGNTTSPALGLASQKS